MLLRPEITCEDQQCWESIVVVHSTPMQQISHLECSTWHAGQTTWLQRCTETTGYNMPKPDAGSEGKTSKKTAKKSGHNA